MTMEARKIHARLQRKMQKAWFDYKIKEDDMDIPKPDLTFLEELDGWGQDVDLEKIDSGSFGVSRRSRRRMNQIGKVAVVLLAVLATVSTAAMFLESDASYGGGSTIQNIKHFFSPKQGPAAENENAGQRDSQLNGNEKQASLGGASEEDLIITEWDNVEKNKDLMIRFFQPTYVPEGYVFQRVWFADTEDVTAAVYTYQKGENELMISVENLKEEGSASVEGDSYVEPKTGREFHIAKDKKDGTCTISRMEEDDVFRVWGALDKEEGIRIIDGLKAM